MSRLWRRRGASPSSRRLSCHSATCFILGRLTSPRRHRIITATLASSKRRRRRPRRSDAHSLADGDARCTTVTPPSPPRCRRHHDGSHVTMAGAAHSITAVMRHHGPAYVIAAATPVVTECLRHHRWRYAPSRPCYVTAEGDAYVTTAGGASAIAGNTRHLYGGATSPRRYLRQHGASVHRLGGSSIVAAAQSSQSLHEPEISRRFPLRRGVAPVAMSPVAMATSASPRASRKGRLVFLGLVRPGHYRPPPAPRPPGQGGSAASPGAFRH